MPGHVTCSPMQESDSASSPHCYDVNNSCQGVLNDLTSPPVTNRSVDGPVQALPGESQTSTTPKARVHSSNFMSATQKNFPLKEEAPKKEANQLDRVVNNSTVLPSNSPSAAKHKMKKKKPVQLAARFPRASGNSPQDTNESLSSHVTPTNSNLSLSSNASSSSETLLSDLVTSMQSLGVSEQSNERAKILSILGAGEKVSTVEMSRRLGMEGQTEELIYSLMKLVEEGKAVKRSERGTSYWSAK